MKITIVGAGAMGSLFGALLAEAGETVRLVDVWPAHVAAINRQGLVVEHEGRTRTVAIRATADTQAAGEADLAILFVKAYQTATAAPTVKTVIKPGGLALTLQNGMGNAEALSAVVTPERVLAGTTAHGATLLGPGIIRHAGVGPTIIGAWNGAAQAAVAAVSECFNRVGIATTIAADVREVIWDKLLVNVGINAISALTGILNGQLQDLEATRWICRAAVEEALAVAAKSGVRMREEAVAHVFAIASATAANRSSMGQDVDQRRATEIGAINGFVVREAQRLGVPIPVNRTLASLVETLQAHF